MKWPVSTCVGIISVLSVLLWQQHARLRAFDSALQSSISASSKRPKGGPQPLPPNVSIRLDGQRRGAATAQVALVEFADFECPYCATFAQVTLPALEAEFVDTGKVLFVFKHLPAHPLSRDAAVAADCAGQQGQFWRMHDSLFRRADTADDAGLTRQAGAIGLNLSQMARCRSTTLPAFIDAQLRQAKQFGIHGTPTLLFGRVHDGNLLNATEIVAGAMPIAALRLELRSLLADQQH